MAQLFANNATSTLNGAIAANTMAITLNPGDGAKFPSPANGDFFLFTMFQRVNGFEVNWEIASCVGRVGDVLTVGARGLDNTNALAYNNGDFIELRFTAGTAGSLAPKNAAVLTAPTLTASPPQFDSSLAVPTTAFVKKAGVQFPGAGIGLGTSAAISLLQLNGWLEFQGVPGNVASLPTLATVPNGATMIFMGGAVGGVVQANGIDTIVNALGASSNTLTVAAGENLMLAANGNGWNVVLDGVSPAFVQAAMAAITTIWTPINSATTAVAGGAYDCDTTNAAFALTLPANPSVNQTVSFCNTKGSFAKNNMTLALNGAPFMWQNVGTVTVSTNYLAVKLTYMGALQGWCITV